MTYLIRCRIYHVKRELLETDASISEIAFRCGFNNLSHFNSKFREVTGHSPRQFRSKFNSREMV